MSAIDPWMLESLFLGDMTDEQHEAVERVHDLGLIPQQVFPEWYAATFLRHRTYERTTAKVHKPYGYSRHAAGRISHAVREVTLRWNGGQVVGTNYQWACGSSTYRAILTDEPADFLEPCLRCEAALERDGDRMDTRVYFAWAPSTGLVKIGFTADVKRRMRQIRPVVEWLADTSGGRRLEREMHERFSHLRVAGEWFKSDPELMDYIDALADAEAVA